MSNSTAATKIVTTWCSNTLSLSYTFLWPTFRYLLIGWREAVSRCQRAILLHSSSWLEGWTVFWLFSDHL